MNYILKKAALFFKNNVMKTVDDTRIIRSIHEVMDRYDHFIVDIWGVLHDGRKPFPFVNETLQELKSQQKSVVLLTNAPQRAHHIYKQLETLGVDTANIDSIVSSGENAYESFMNANGGALENQSSPKNQLQNCFAFESSFLINEFISDCQLTRVGRLEEAAFILAIHPPHIHTHNQSDFNDQFAIAIENKIPMVCVNPDVGVISNGEFVPCAGHFARFFSDLGGVVYYHGKPYKPVYEAAMKAIPEAKKSKTLAIGDSLATDIAGATHFGLDSLLVLSGLSGFEMDSSPTNKVIDPENKDDEINPLNQLISRKLNQSLKQSSVRPTYVCSGFR